ncbi:MAG: hypothetical protein PX481_04040 [Microcystis sp. M53603_WE2]|uniref:hypothetical protein n=1 Tax=unclassified Microcystis TaxID=2643300 RepID=UPI0002E16E32|nr:MULTISPECIES: hypothetical protein [unclassified Microcystis]MCZ8026612.1 hypothetical protein [Microcystis sp. LE19-10.1B]MDJ0529137.1 hypothetical protein [Microcystis sp. M53600_WE12]MDJ0537870.1 hypothetical protein [Microcystis sp. M53603_WE2]MDJ0605337.1 hypothetical protein [Microcystis sp. M53602_WE12]
MKKFSPPQMKEVSFPTPHTPHPTPHFPTSPLPHFPTSPHPTPHTLHPTPYTPLPHFLTPSFKSGGSK